METSLIRKKQDRESKNYLREYVWNIKRNGKCCRCGYDHPAALQFHHIDKTLKTKSIQKLVSKRYSMKSLVEEIAKCELICANCHFIEHYDESVAIGLQWGESRVEEE